MKLPILLLTISCGPLAVSADQSFEHSQPLTFRTENNPELNDPLDCAIDRINYSTGLDLQSTPNGKHLVVRQSRETMFDLYGWTTGPWNSASIRLADDMKIYELCPMLIHELAQHLLRRSNDHVETGRNVFILTEPTLVSICQKQPCTAFEPELPFNL